jgi:hypothetical protein
MPNNEKRKNNAIRLARLSLILGALCALSTIVAGIFAAVLGMSRETDAHLILAELALVAGLLFGMPAGAVAIIWGERRKAIIGIGLWFLSALTFWALARKYMSPA